MWRILAVATAAVLAACGGIGEEPRRAPAAGDPVGETGNPVYEATAVVLEREDHGPMLCLGGVLQSLPPQCGDVDIANWDWGTVPDERSLSGTTWGRYHVVGTYEGTSFTVRHTGPPQTEASDDPGIGTACPEPAGGWVAPDPSRTSEQDRLAAIRAAEAEPDFSAAWIDYADETPTEQEVMAAEPGYVILNAAFTGEVERHTAQLRELWGGPLCVVEHDRTSEELRAIQKDLEPSEDELGIQVLWSSIDVEDNVVEVGVVVLGPEARAAIDARYGDGAVRVQPALTPVQ